MRKRLYYALLLGLVDLQTACFGGEKLDEPGIMTLETWPDYFPREVIRQFEKEYGIRVNVMYLSTLTGSSGG